MRAHKSSEEVGDLSAIINQRNISNLGYKETPSFVYFNGERVGICYVPSLRLCQFWLENGRCIYQENGTPKNVALTIKNPSVSPRLKLFLFALYQFNERWFTAKKRAMGDGLCEVDDIWNIIAHYHGSNPLGITDNVNLFDKYIIDAFKEFIYFKFDSINDAKFVLDQFMNNDIIIKYLENQTSATLLEWLACITLKFDADNVGILFSKYVKYDDKKAFNKIFDVLLKNCMDQRDRNQYELIFKLLSQYNDGQSLSNMRWDYDGNILTYGISKYVECDYKYKYKFYSLLKTIILKKDFDCNQSDKSDEYPLLKACKYKLEDVEEIIKLLLVEGNADININDEYGMVPIMVAVKYGNMRMFRWLLSHKPEINIWTKENHNIFTIICTSKLHHLERSWCTELLIQYATENNIGLEYLWTDQNLGELWNKISTIHFIELQGCTEMIEMLKKSLP